MNSASASVSLNIANFRAEMLSSLMNLGSNDGSSFATVMSQVQGASDAPWAALNSGASPGATSAMLLSDRRSAYAIMTRINGLEVTYKGQYSELSQMDAYLPKLEEAARKSGETTATVADDSIVAGLQDFARQYNAWIQRFKPDVQAGGVLANTQAGEIPLYELDQVIENRFIGAKDGFNGLADLGISVAPTTGLMSVDTGKLSAALGKNRQAVVETLQEFSTKFAASADFLAAKDNLIQHRLNNLSGAIAYIGGNVGSWQQEFGLGDAATPAGPVALALAAYNNAHQM